MQVARLGSPGAGSSTRSTCGHARHPADEWQCTAQLLPLCPHSSAIFALYSTQYLLFSLFYSYRCRVSLKVSPTLRAPWWSNHTEAENFVVPSARRTSMPLPDSEPVTTTSGLKEYLLKICVFFRERVIQFANQKLTNHEGFIIRGVAML